MRETVIALFRGGAVVTDPAHPRNVWPAPDGTTFCGSVALRSAAVLVPLVDHPSGLTVILTQRTDSLSSHAGQICFPGGRKAEADESAEATALREAEEEVGLSPSRVRILGRLNGQDTRTGYRVMPVVGLVAPPLTLVPDPSEVADVFELPVAHLLDPTNHRFERRIWNGAERTFRIIPYGERFIWGLTARVLGELAEMLGRR